MFGSLMREHTNAIFVGEETGAARCGAGGMLTQIRLPHSSLRIRFSTGKYIAQVRKKANSRGVLPDIELDKVNGLSHEELLKILSKRVR